MGYTFGRISNMGKGKYKRKRQLAKQHQQDKRAHPLPAETQQGTTEKAEGSETRHGQRIAKKEPSMGFRKRLGELWERSSLTDRIIMVFTGILAGAAIYQFIIMDNQLDTMRKDQRPWVKISFTSSPAQAFASIGGAVQIVNNGKTPAGKVTGEFVVEKVMNGEEPILDYPKAHVTVFMGMIFPNDKPEVIAIERKRLSQDGHHFESDLLTPDEFRDFTNVKIFFVAYGTLRYSDFFGVDHWTKFCSYIYPPNPPPVRRAP